jgi:uncharacterized protein
MASASKGFKGKIVAHPTLSFFIVAFLISWTAWFLAPVIGGNDKALTNLIDLIAAFGPALAAIFISAIIEPTPSDASTRKRYLTFTIIFSAAFVFQLLSLLSLTNNLGIVSGLSAAISSAIVAYVVSSVYHPKQGVAKLMSGLKRVSPKSIWVWIAVLLPFAFQFVGALTDLGLGGKDLLSSSILILVAVAASFPSIFFFGGPLNEEPGWRGFATPQLQAKYSPLITGLIIGVIWTIWHFPLHVTAFYGDGVNGFLFRFIFNVPLGILFTWLYNRSGGNLFACILLHTSINATSAMFGGNNGLYAMIALIVFTAAAVLSDRMYKNTTKSELAPSLPSQNPIIT